MMTPRWLPIGELEKRGTFDNLGWKIAFVLFVCFFGDWRDFGLGMGKSKLQIKYNTIQIPQLLLVTVEWKIEICKHNKGRQRFRTK